MDQENGRTRERYRQEWLASLEEDKHTSPVYIDLQYRTLTISLL